MEQPHYLESEKVAEQIFTSRRKTYYLTLRKNVNGRYLKLETRSGSVRQAIFVGEDAFTAFENALEKLTCE